MSPESDESDRTTLSPDDAFAALGNETRMDILQTLGTADDPLPFSELRERDGMRDSGQFNYHLDKLTDHFVQRTDSSLRSSSLFAGGRLGFEPRSLRSLTLASLPDSNPAL